MANEQRTVRPQCTGVAATAGGGKGGGRAGRGLGLGPGRWGGGAEDPGGGRGRRRRERLAGGRGPGEGNAEPSGGPGSREGRAYAVGAGLRGDRQLASVRSWPPPRCPHAPTRARDAHFPSFATRSPGTWKMTVGAVGAAARPCHLLGAGGCARGSELILFCSLTKAGPAVPFALGDSSYGHLPLRRLVSARRHLGLRATIVSLKMHRRECLTALMKWKFK